MAAHLKSDLDAPAGSQDAPTSEHTTAPALWIVLTRTYHAIAGTIEHSLAALHIGLSDFMALEVLLHKGPLSMSAIGARILLANASMTSAIDRLDRLGLVTRTGSDCDRRVRLVNLTPAGRALITDLYRRHAEELETLMADLPQADRRQLRRGLKTIGLAARAAAVITESPQDPPYPQRVGPRSPTTPRSPAEPSGDRPK